MAYAFSQSDGGAQIGSSTRLELSGETLIDISPFGGFELKLATFDLIGKAKQLRKVRDDNYETTWFSQDAKVVLNAGGAGPAFAELVLCRQTRYIGIPRP